MHARPAPPSFIERYVLLVRASFPCRTELTRPNVTMQEFGSALIYSVGYRSPWAMIGKRGAASGSVPEATGGSGTHVSVTLTLASPSQAPSASPSQAPSASPSQAPSASPSQAPTATTDTCDELSSLTSELQRLRDERHLLLLRT
jgi:hypothetical protein